MKGGLTGFAGVIAPTILHRTRLFSCKARSDSPLHGPHNHAENESTHDQRSGDEGEIEAQPYDHRVIAELHAVAATRHDHPTEGMIGTLYERGLAVNRYRPAGVPGRTPDQKGRLFTGVDLSSEAP